MEHDLISGEDFHALPEEPELRFLALEAVCKNNLLNLITRETSREYDSSLRLEYMAIIAAAAEELGIDGLWMPSPDDDIPANMTAFSLAVSKITTKLRLRNSGKGSPYSVQLANRTRGRIKLEVQRLRDIIDASDLDGPKKSALFKKLDELAAEIDGHRVNFAKVMAILAVVGLGVTTGTSFLADAPNAMATITSLIGADKEAENRERQRLGPPPAPKALPAPDRAFRRYEQELDDEIPF